MFLSLLLTSELIQQTAQVNFMLFFKHFENLENPIWNILKKKLHITWLRSSFFPEKRVKFLE